jgi:hypothetical protein
MVHDNNALLLNLFMLLKDIKAVTEYRLLPSSLKLQVEQNLKELQLHLIQDTKG